MMPVNMPAPPPAAAPTPATPSAPMPAQSPAPGSDKGPPPPESKGLDAMFERIEKDYGRDPSEVMATPGKSKGKSKAAEAKPEAKPESKPVEKVEEKAPEKAEDFDEDDPVKAPEKKVEEAKPAETEKAPEAKEGKKANPWKLLDESKSVRAKLEKEIAELRKVVPNEQQRKDEIEKVTKLEAQNKELLDKIRYYDYQQHPEFKEKYEQPYVGKWNEIWSEIAGATVQDGETQRNVAPADIAKLGNLPVHSLIKEAKQMFGEDAGPWVAERVRELRNLSKAKTEALEKVKAEGAERITKEQEAQTKEQAELSSHLEQNWVKANEELENHSKYGEYLKAKEGDEEHNQAIERGAEFVKKAWTLDPREKGISPEERTARLKRQVKLQRYAAGFASLYLSEQRFKQKYESAMEKLKQYEASTPKVDGGTVPNSAPQNNGYTLDSFEQSLMAKARPGIV